MGKLATWVKAAGHAVGIDIHRVENTLDGARKRLLLGEKIDLVLDVGANHGQYVKEIRALGYRGDILSFEPLPDAYAYLSTAMQGDPRWSGQNCALADKPGRAQFHVSQNSVSSSLLEITDQSVEVISATRAVAAIEVEVKTLEAAAAGRLSGKRVHLKIDTQGSELSVIEGAGALLDQVQTVECELSLVELYRGQPLLHTVVERLYRAGFRAVWLERGFRNQRLELLQMDGLFTRSPNV
jgi:FkbM family methyltransferase